MRMRSAAVVAGLAIGVVSGQASAAVIEYTSQVEFQAATGLSQTGFSDVNGPVLPNPIMLGPIKVEVRDGSIYKYNDNTYGAGVQYIGLVGSSPFEVVAAATSKPGVSAVGFTLGTLDSDVINVTVNGNVLAPIATPRAPSTVFLGFTSTDPITSLELATSFIRELDVINYSYQPAGSMSPVPLPASAPMFGAALLGLAGLGYAAKRKKEVAAA